MRLVTLGSLVESIRIDKSPTYNGRVKYTPERARAYQVRAERKERAELRLVERAFGVIPRGRVLDAPCGGGRVTMMLAGLGYKMTAADLSDAMLAITREKIAGSGLKIPVEPQDLGKADLGIASVREFASFVLAWLGYAVLSYHLASAMGRAEDWPRFVVLWNWSNLVQYLLMACALTPALFGAPPIIGQTGWVVAMGWSLWLQWSATRIGLVLPAGRAALMVAADMALGMVVLRLTAG